MLNNEKTFFRRAVIVSASLLSIFVTGCASVAVSDQAIEQNTASALGLEMGSFNIFNRVDSGLKASYEVKTNSGKKYTCYVTGTVSILGRMVSDSVCNESGKSSGQTSGSVSSSCNALLKAAGRCN